MGNEFIWLFGENLGNTANNNSFFFWKHVVNQRDGIQKYLVLTKSEENLKKYHSFNSEEKKYVLWRNSIKHILTYLQADMLFVTLSYKDIMPDKVLYKNVNWYAQKPVIYLQHGITAIKQLGYQKDSYNNNLFRFVYYNPEMKDKFQEINKFKEYQLYYGEYFPRYTEMLLRSDEYHLNHNSGKNILWFLTWREYFGNNFTTKLFAYNTKKILNSSILQEYLIKKHATITVCLHQFLTENYFSDFDIPNVKIVTPSHVDVMDLLAENDLLITDYSSVGFDFTFLNKPVILYQPDLKSYLTKRKLYCEIDELEAVNLTQPQELVDAIVNESYSINPFFRKRLPKNIDYDYIRRSGQIDKMYKDFSAIQKNKITFLGYNFYGVGGTVFATRALAEGLLEKGYFVELLSLKKTNEAKNPPAALNMSYCYDARPRNKVKKIELLKRLIRFKFHFRYLKYDPSINYLIPYAELALKHKLTHIRSKTVISTRESLHLFLNDASSSYIKNKVFFFHTDANVLDSTFPGVIDRLNIEKIDHAAFVTENNRQQLAIQFGYRNYSNYGIVGNALDSSRCIDIDDICTVEKKDVYTGAYLLRMSEERKPDLDNLINFGVFLKENHIDDIKIDVYGSGDCLPYFLEKVFENNLSEIIRHMGVTSSPKRTLTNYDALVDFSLSQSFGMTYIEGILNGKMVYCMENTGSSEVLRDIPACFIHSFDDLVQKMRHLPDIPLDELRSNYQIIADKYSRDVVARHFIDSFGL